MLNKETELWFFRVVVLALTGVIAVMLWPYASMMVLAATMAFLFSGVCAWIERIVRYRTLATLLTAIIVVVAIVIPLSLLGYRMVQEAGNLYAILQAQTSGQHIITLLGKIQESTRSYIPATSLDARAISDRLQQLLGWVIGNIGTVFTGITRILLGFIFFLLFFFYLLKDGAPLMKRVIALSPLSSAHEHSIINRMTSVLTGTIRGQVVYSILQGLAIGCGFAFFGVPNPVLWGSIVVLTSFIPVIGTWLIIIPCALFLLAQGLGASAAGLALWSITASMLLDYVVQPKLLSQGTHIHPLITMVAVLGGLQMFGPIGILIGPLLVSTLFSFLTIMQSA